MPLRRKLADLLALLFAGAATLFGLTWLIWILGTTLVEGGAALSPQLFTAMTPPPGESGGLLNAFYGSAVMVLLALAIGTPIGVAAGTHLAEHGHHSRAAVAIGFINDVLLSAPSIIIGLFIYALLVVPFRHFSGWAGAAALGLIALPVINRTTQDMLGLVPSSLREATAALGAPRWKAMVAVIYRAAGSGILTGVLLAIARVSGETAPLLFTALNNQFFSTDLGAPMANLPVVIFQFATSPYDDWQKLAWGGALLITLTILLLNIVARALAGRRSNS
jgi:phosphate transport system permease protein